jgi:hypothetical protein
MLYVRDMNRFLIWMEGVVEHAEEHMVRTFNLITLWSMALHKLQIWTPAEACVLLLPDAEAGALICQEIGR